MSGAAGEQDPIYRVGTDFSEVAALGQILGDGFASRANADPMPR